MKWFQYVLGSLKVVSVVALERVAVRVATPQVLSG
jgi:hypothetical protein